jgi:hypothetical protein
MAKGGKAGASQPASLVQMAKHGERWRRLSSISHPRGRRFESD